MPKTKKRQMPTTRRRARRSAPLTQASLRAALPTLKVVKVTGPVTVSVDTTTLQIPFHVGIDGDTFMDGAFSAQKTATLSAGTHHLNWFFNHQEADWNHELGVRSASGSEELDSRSKAKGDKAISAGVVVLLVS